MAKKATKAVSAADKIAALYAEIEEIKEEAKAEYQGKFDEAMDAAIAVLNEAAEQGITVTVWRDHKAALGLTDSAKAAAPAVSGGRMSKAEKEAAVQAAIDFIGANDGVGKAEICEAIGVATSSWNTISKALKETGAVKTEGERAATKFYAA